MADPLPRRPDQQPTTIAIRSAVPIFNYTLLGALTAGISVGASLELFVPPSVEVPVGALIFVVIASATISRAVRVVLEIGPRGVLIHNYFRSFSLEWTEISEVTSSVPVHMKLPVEVLAFRERRTGRTAAAMATLTTRPRLRRIVAIVRTRAERHGIPTTFEP
jgi:hypothetical protein